MDERVKNLPAMWETLEKGMATYPVFLNGELHGQRSLADYSPWGHKESDTTEGPAIFGFLYFLRQIVYQGMRNIFASHQIWVVEVCNDIAMITESMHF